MSEFAKHRARRKRFVEKMGKGVAIFPSAPVFIRNRDVEHPYRQDSDFYYLTGFDEPESWLVLDARSTVPTTILFLRPKDEAREIWDGRRLGVDAAPSTLAVDEARSIDAFRGCVADFLEDAGTLYFGFGKHRAYDDLVLAAIEEVRGRARKKVEPPRAIVDPDVILHEHRLHKSEEELEIMRRASRITDEAHRAAMRIAAPGRYEYELEAEITRVFRARGAERPAYETIVGSGPNATILHHRKNDRRIEDGDLVLIDAGCELDYYASDVTRTFPANGRFTPAQRRVYETVLSAQAAAIRAVAPGATLDTIHRAAVEVLVGGLLEMGLLSGDHAEIVKDGSYSKFYMHRTSHFLGMDVHDVGVYHVDKAPRPLEPGMVITVEPGLYIGENADVDETYRGIGVRIEDDVVVTADGCENLTAHIPKNPDEVEALVGAR
jgi:Xaa-Pro aminopeptidase